MSVDAATPPTAATLTSATYATSATFATKSPLKDTRTDVLIVGAGPTGLTLACDLARRGVNFRIVERSEGASQASKAKTIQPRALEVLDDLGAVSLVLRRGVTDLPMRFHDAAGGVRDAPTMSVRAAEAFHSPYRDPIWVGQFDVEEALRQRLAEHGGSVHYGAEVVDARQVGDGVRIVVSTTTGTEKVRARYVVAADGGKSGLRKFAGAPLVGESYEDQRWYLGDVTIADLGRDRMHIWTSDRGMIGLTPLPGTNLWQLQSPIRPEDEPGEPSLELYQRMLDERAGVGTVTLTSATWLSVYRVNVRMVEHYRHGRIFLAGDAAHVHSPAGGQGMNTGIQDAYNLGWKLATVLDGADETLLDTYGAERIPVARAVLEDSTRKMQQTTASVTSSSNDGLSSALGSIADDITTGLPVGYPNSLLTLRTPQTAAAAVVPGDRVPDAGGLWPASNTGGFSGVTTVTVFDLLRGPHWTLLAYDHDEPLILDGAPPTDLHLHRIHSGQPTAKNFVGEPGVVDSGVLDSVGNFQLYCQAEAGELFLIRPDGYLAARVPAASESKVLNHLAAYRPDGARPDNSDLPRRRASR